MTVVTKDKANSCKASSFTNAVLATLNRSYLETSLMGEYHNYCPTC